ncbi:MAG: GNAT family N-acetyltransferase [Bacteroidota bacterium]|nr:GNAT family N-acetyltransferase [Bacteroidota bacterium]
MAQIYFETERLILRDWKESDTAVFIEMNLNKNVMQYFPSILNEDETLQMLEKIKKHFADFDYGLFAVERKDNKNFIGYTGFSHPKFESFFTPCIEIGWRLNFNDWNFGFATEAAKASMQYGFDKIGLKEIYSFTSIRNKPSENVMQKIGMKKVGTFEHPLLANGHYLKTHVLYKIEK